MGETNWWSGGAQSLSATRAGVLVTGKYDGPASAGGLNYDDVAAVRLPSADSNGSMYAAKFDTDGTVVFARSFGTYRSQENFIRGIIDDLGNCYVAGDVQANPAPADLFGLGPVTPKGSDLFIAKYDTVGAPRWARVYGDGASQTAMALGLHGTTPIVASQYQGSMQLAPTITVDGGVAGNVAVAKIVGGD